MARSRPGFLREMSGARSPDVSSAFASRDPARADDFLLVVCNETETGEATMNDRNEQRHDNAFIWMTDEDLEIASGGRRIDQVNVVQVQGGAGYPGAYGG